MSRLLTELIAAILEAGSKQDPVLQYRDKKGKSRSGKASSLAGYAADTPGRKAYDDWKSGQGGKAIAAEPEKAGDKDAQQPATSTQRGQRAPATRDGAGTNRQKPKVPQSAEVPMSVAPGTTPPKPLTKGSAKRDTELLDSTIEQMNNRGFDSPDDAQRFDTFTSLWKSFLGAPTYEEQVKAVRALAEYNMIEAGASGKKIYVTSNTGLTYKHMCSDRGSDTAVTRLMNQIISAEGIQVGMRGSAADRALADMSGKHNEAGVTAYLDPNSKNKEAYKNAEDRYKQLGGDSDAADLRNKDAADVIVNSLPKGAKIINATQVGGIGPIELKRLGINPKTDPTDILIEYSVNGKKQVMKISAKIYTDPRNITMKNSGVTKAGADYLGEPEGSEVDAIWPRLWKKYKWTPDMPDEEKITRKSKLRQEYLKTYAGEMEKLAKTKEGQDRLLKMWQAVHGCGKNVHTLVIDKSSGKSELKSPDHYCKPSTPFKVKYDGIKVVIEMNTGGPQTLQIDMKTEDRGSPKLLFRHIIRDKKK
jgi:hypothetical protein